MVPDANPIVSDLLFPLVGVIVGVIVGAYLAERSRRVETTLELFRAFNTADSLESRSRADKLLLSVPRGKLDMDDLYLDKNVEELNHVWVVLGFYEQIAAGLRHNRLDEKIAVDLFGANFIYWYHNFFSSNFRSVDKETPKIMKDVYSEVLRVAGKERVDQWKERAEAFAGRYRS